MNDLDFRTFSPRSFERFTQALCQHVLGKGLQIYGDGPDGGREATFDGTLNYPSEAEKWSGYLVVQAKFRQTPGTPAEDAEWLKNELRKEFEKYITNGSQYKSPEYYIIVSNAKLSPKGLAGKGSGGIEKIDSIFNKYGPKLKIKGWRIWHYDVLVSHLATAEALRRSYAVWLTPSDLVSTIIDKMNSRSRIFNDAILRYLCRELRNQHPISLQQAGHGVEVTIMIEDVFSDLPFKLYGSGEYSEGRNMLLNSLLKWSKDRVAPSETVVRNAQASLFKQKILLLGGPGQGKSTITQFLAQILRANILKDVFKNVVSEEISDICEKILIKAENIGLDVTIPKRFPLRIELPHYADQVEKSADTTKRFSLISYIAQQIANISDTNISLDDVRLWIREYPTVIMLDGLDEVPASANRAKIIKAINEFWDDVLDANLLMIVTSRPQGYNDDLSPSQYHKIELTPLDRQSAFQCGEKLANVRIVDPVQRQKSIDRLRVAVEGAATARLMVSPLQVAIMLALIVQRGDVPTDRWNLFYKYFNLVLEREQSKTGPVGEVMRQWGNHVTKVHHTAGFMLHVESESQGKSEAFLLKDDLSVIINAHLSSVGYDGDQLTNHTQLILSVATERLVLIVQSEDGKFRFEVRSLQEFMAAAYIMSGQDILVQKRLRQIASRTHWLHVFQIAASKCFATIDAEHYCDTIVNICWTLNNTDSQLDKILCTGSSLALALLDDGLAYDKPEYRKQLFLLALDVMKLGIKKFPHSIVRHCRGNQRYLLNYFSAFSKSERSETFFSYCKLVLECALDGQDWALKDLEKIKVDDIADVLTILSIATDAEADKFLGGRFDSVINNVRPSEVLDAASKLFQKRSISYDCVSKIPGFGFLRFDTSNNMTAKIVISDEFPCIETRFCSVQISADRVIDYNMIPNADAWDVVLQIKKFHTSPDKMKLAELLSKAIDNGWLGFFRRISRYLPWPLATLSWECLFDKDPHKIIDQVIEGVYGDFKDWKSAEERWVEHGIVDDDFLPGFNGKFFTLENELRGVPIGVLAITHGRQDGQLWVNKLFNYYISSAGAPRKKLLEVMDFVLYYYDLDVPVGSLFIKDFVEFKRIYQEKFAFNIALLRLFGVPFAEEDNMLSILNDLIDECDALYSRFSSDDDEKLLEAIKNVFDVLCNNSHLRLNFNIAIAHLAISDIESTSKWKISSHILNLMLESENVKVRSYGMALNFLNYESNYQCFSIFIAHLDRIDYLQPLYYVLEYIQSTVYRKEAEIWSEIIAQYYVENDGDILLRCLDALSVYANARVLKLKTQESWRSLGFDNWILDHIKTREG